MKQHEHFTVRFEVCGAQTVLSRHRSAETCAKSFRRWSRVLKTVFHATSHPIRVWQQDGAGTVLQQHFYEPDEAGGEDVEVGQTDSTALGPFVGTEAKEWAAMLWRLGAAGVSSMVLVYDGAKGQHRFNSLAANNDSFSAVYLDPHLTASLEELCYRTVLPICYEEGDGGFGEVVIDVDARTVAMEHCGRTPQTEHPVEAWSVPMEDDDD